MEPSSVAALVAPNAQMLVAEWIDHCKTKPPGRVTGQMAHEIKTLLDEGYAYADVRAAVAEWATKRLAPSVLPSILNGRLNVGPSQTRPGGRPTPTERAQQTLAAGAAVAAALAAKPRLEIAR
jgi:predicted Abi (CAAX) family protease